MPACTYDSISYASMDQPLPMNDEDRGRLLTAILGRDPSEESWQALWELFGDWPESRSRTQHIDIAASALAAWPDKLRFAHSSDRRLYDGTHLTILGRLVRSIEIYRSEEQGSGELFAIALSEYSAGLTYLSIVRSEISSRAWQAALKSPHLSNLRHLHVRKTVLGDSETQRLFQSASFSRLECLKLTGVGLRPQHLDIARQSLPFPVLSDLDLSSNALADDGIRLLSQYQWLSQIKRLSIRDNYLRAEGIRTLLSSHFCQRMEQIDAEENRVDDTGKKDLLEFAAKKNIYLKL